MTLSACALTAGGAIFVVRSSAGCTLLSAGGPPPCRCACRLYVDGEACCSGWSKRMTADASLHRQLAIGPEANRRRE